MVCHMMYRSVYMTSKISYEVPEMQREVIFVNIELSDLRVAVIL